MSQRLELKQGQIQSLTMTPQLQQAIKLLQLSNLELSAYLEAELEKNPLLERVEQESNADENAALANTHHNEIEDRRDRSHDDDQIIRQGNHDNEFEREWHDGDREQKAKASDYSDFDAGTMMAQMGKGGHHKFEDDSFSLENTLSENKSLRTHLIEQLKVDIIDPVDQMIGSLFIDHLDEAGYLRLDLTPLAEKLNTPLARLEKVLERMKSFDPAGIFARDLADCLALQLKDKNRLDPAMRALLDHLPLLAMHDYKKLQKICGVDEADLKDMISEIKALNPRPAAAFDHFISQTAVPDVLMKRLPKEMGGGFGVELNADTLPRVLVNQKYYTEVLKSAHHKADKEYLSMHMQSANWLIRALDQRAQTILKVASEIIQRQEAFFLYGVEYLKPMILKDIAEAIGMHESTISRVTMGKFIGTPRGLFELKYFFQSGVGSADGASTYAAHAVKSRIKALIDAESHDHVLSDDDLVERLTAEGIEIARRTVAKYREAMGIQSSVQRRRLLKQKA